MKIANPNVNSADLILLNQDVLRREVNVGSNRQFETVASCAERALVVLLAVSTMAFLILPLLIVIPMSFSSASSLTFPPPGFSMRWYASFFSDPAWLTSAWNSFVIATASSALSLALGTTAAYGLVRGRFGGRRLLEANFLAPMIVPPIILAIALYVVFARIGLLGTFPAVIIAHTLMTIPYVIVLMSVAISTFDSRIEDAARTLGAGDLTMFSRVLLPNLLPSIGATSILIFIVSFDEVVLTIFLFGTKFTIPKLMFNRLELQVDPTITAVATLLILFTLLALASVALLTGRAGPFAFVTKQGKENAVKP